MSALRNRLASAIRDWPSPPARPLVGVLPGEGVGPQVIAAAVAVMCAIEQCTDHRLELRFGGAIGTEAMREHGAALPLEVADFCAQIFEERGAVLSGPAGGRFVYDLRARFNLYCKLTPISPVASLQDARVVRPDVLNDVDFVIVRENAGGLYFGDSHRETGMARQTFTYRAEEVRRILDVAVRLSKARASRLALVIKPAAMPAVTELWVEHFEAMSTGLDTRVLEVDNAVYQIVADARAFDVIVAPNLFGDILSDGAALLLGSRGLSHSGNFGPNGAAVYQTGHGCAHDLVGSGIANPLGQIRAVAMMLQESFGLVREAEVIDAAIEETVAAGVRTPDIAGPDSAVVGTEEMGRRVAEAVGRRL